MRPHSTTATPPVVHPYARISDPAQRKGGGLERQTKADVDEFARRFGFTPSKRVLIDDGVSAFKGLNATPEHQLGQFLAEARRGLVRAGDCLLVENWDRLSRQDPWAAISLINDLRQCGIHLGRLDRMKLLRYDSTDTGDFFDAALELIRGHSESAMKSMRNGAAWVRKRQAARDSGAVLTRTLPLWVEERAGELRLIPERAATVRRVFALAAAGYGANRLVKKLQDDGIEPFGRARWTRSYLANILSDRRALGEYQPRSRGKVEGEPIKGYYPAAVDEATFYAARAGRAERKRKRGRTSEYVNVFAGLLKDALSHESFFVQGRQVRPGEPYYRVLQNFTSTRGAKVRAFRLDVFERAVLSHLREIDPHEILNGDAGPDDSLALAAQLAGVEAELAEASAFMDANGFSATIGKRVTALEERKRQLAADLAEARQRAAHPLSESWGESQSLIDALDKAIDAADARLRLRSALRRIVESIYLLVVPRGRDRLCAVQVWFAGGKRERSYLILHKRPKGNGKWRVEGRVWSKSLADAAGPADLDLRKPAHARRLEEVLAAVPLAEG
jgi:DNA invertase Pin-like site-specific DNA recombinase